MGQTTTRALRVRMIRLLGGLPQLKVNHIGEYSILTNEYRS